MNPWTFGVRVGQCAQNSALETECIEVRVMIWGRLVMESSSAVFLSWILTCAIEDKKAAS